MPLTSKLRADYVELINNQLDTIKFDSLEDFVLVEQALQNIIQPMENYSQPEKYREKMSFIGEYLQSPEDYVEHESNYSEYQQIIRERINAKIHELQSLDMTQKQCYIQHQQTLRSQIQANQQTMAERQPPQPGSDAHVLNQEQWLRELQISLNSSRDTNQTPRIVGLIERRLNYTVTEIDILELGRELNLTEREILTLRGQFENIPHRFNGHQRNVENTLRLIDELEVRPNNLHSVIENDSTLNLNRNHIWLEEQRERPATNPSLWNRALRAMPEIESAVNIIGNIFFNHSSTNQNQTSVREGLTQLRNIFFNSHRTQNSTQREEEQQRPRR